MVENRVLREVFGFKEKEATRYWRKYSEEHLFLRLAKWYLSDQMREDEKGRT
jgi:hypothetical protein